MLHFNSMPVKASFQTGENAVEGVLSPNQTPLSLHRCKVQRTFSQKPYLVGCVLWYHPAIMVSNRNYNLSASVRAFSLKHTHYTLPLCMLNGHA